MKNFYLLALQKIRTLKAIPSTKEWNTIAKYENYMSAESIEYISQKKFNEVCTEIRN